ncbi:MAG: DNA/RNA nuclease SfsA, partial [Actinobacteria bacterium]|nr:DNA/RNA nuclease SfsA [Actinomycetota bacterium]
LEVKSVTRAADGIARFPDAPTERGRRHVAELTEAARGGDRAGLLFVVGREDVRQVRPYTAIDPEFARALAVAKEAGVVLRAVRFGLDARGTATCLGPVPVRLG